MGSRCAGYLTIFAVFIASFQIALASAQTVEATTANGDRVLLHPNGRWEYVDQKKAEQARAAAQLYPENQGCPPGAQGGFFGFGRCIRPGDKDYNRGSLNLNRR